MLGPTLHVPINFIYYSMCAFNSQAINQKRFFHLWTVDIHVWHTHISTYKYRQCLNPWPYGRTPDRQTKNGLYPQWVFGSNFWLTGANVACFFFARHLCTVCELSSKYYYVLCHGFCHRHSHDHYKFFQHLLMTIWPQINHPLISVVDHKSNKISSVLIGHISA